MEIDNDHVRAMKFHKQPENFYFESFDSLLGGIVHREKKDSRNLVAALNFTEEFQVNAGDGVMCNGQLRISF